MKNLMISILIISFLANCTKNSDEPVGDIVNANIRYNIINEAGDDLLNSDNDGYFPFSDMKLYYIENNQKVEVYDENMDSPRNINVISGTDLFTLKISLLYHGDEDLISEDDDGKWGQSTALIELSASITDTIVYEWANSKSNFTVSKIWYNGEEHSRNDIFQVIK